MHLYLISNSNYIPWIIFALVIYTLFYVIFIFILSTIFSSNLYNLISSSGSENFECGFYSIIMSSMRYRYNYWIIIFHFLLFELELLISLFIVFALIGFNSNLMVCLLLNLLYIELNDWIND